MGEFKEGSYAHPDIGNVPTPTISNVSPYPSIADRIHSPQDWTDSKALAHALQHQSDYTISPTDAMAQSLNTGFFNKAGEVKSDWSWPSWDDVVQSAKNLAKSAWSLKGLQVVLGGIDAWQTREAEQANNQLGRDLLKQQGDLQRESLDYARQRQETIDAQRERDRQEAQAKVREREGQLSSLTSQFTSPEYLEEMRQLAKTQAQPVINQIEQNYKQDMIDFESRKQQAESQLSSSRYRGTVFDTRRRQVNEQLNRERAIIDRKRTDSLSKVTADIEGIAQNTLQQNYARATQLFNTGIGVDQIANQIRQGNIQQMNQSLQNIDRAYGRAGQFAGMQQAGVSGLKIPSTFSGMASDVTRTVFDKPDFEKKYDFVLAKTEDEDKALKAISGYPVKGGMFGQPTPTPTTQ